VLIPPSFLGNLFLAKPVHVEQLVQALKAGHAAVRPHAIVIAPHATPSSSLSTAPI
jgi:hypothetical protein